MREVDLPKAKTEGEKDFPAGSLPQSAWRLTASLAEGAFGHTPVGYPLVIVISLKIKRGANE